MGAELCPEGKKLGCPEEKEMQPAFTELPDREDAFCPLEDMSGLAEKHQAGRLVN